MDSQQYSEAHDDLDRLYEVVRECRNKWVNDEQMSGYVEQIQLEIAFAMRKIYIDA